MPKQIKAPQYFIDVIDEEEKIEARVAEILGVGKEWLRQTKEGIDNLMDEKKFNREQKDNIFFLLQTKKSFADYRWRKFRWEHWNEDNDFARGYLNYDEKKQVIKIKNNPIDQVINYAKKVFQKINASI